MRDIYTNRKKAWKDVKTLQEQSSFNLRGDYERPINGIIPYLSTQLMLKFGRKIERIYSLMRLPLAVPLAVRATMTLLVTREVPA